MLCFAQYWDLVEDGEIDAEERKQAREVIGKLVIGLEDWDFRANSSSPVGNQLLQAAQEVLPHADAPASPPDKLSKVALKVPCVSLHFGQNNASDVVAF